jgi:16S rRNA (adenine1518-N6/adenine1519-N6)-dimethyltransferase
VLEARDRVDELVGMFQKEVADRLASPPGRKTYGKLTVLLNAFYDVEYIMTVNPGAFFPVPRVRSAVIRLKRKAVRRLACDERFFFRIVLQGFQNRRKILRNALIPLNLPSHMNHLEMMNRRAEQLSVDDFVVLCRMAEKENDR